MSTANWAETNWTNKQFIARCLAETFHVDYIESLGLRRPELTGDDLRRAARRVAIGSANRGRRRLSEPVPDNITVHSPLALPFHGARPAIALNRLLLRRFGQRLVSRGSHDVVRVLWSFTPITYGLEDLHDLVVYQSVDLLHEFPLMPSVQLISGERRLITIADRVIASSSAVQRHLRALGRSDTVLWENVADSEQITSDSRPEPENERRAVFMGNITSSKLDFDVMVNAVRPGSPVTGIDLYGPVPTWDHKATEFVSSLPPYIRYMGIIPRQDIGRILSRYWVGLIPYIANPYTEGVFPMKVYEYMAAGLPVVYSGLGSLTTSQDLFEATRTDAAEVVERALSRRVIDRERRQQVAAGHSWSQRGQDARNLVHELVS